MEGVPPVFLKNLGVPPVLWSTGFLRQVKPVDHLKNVVPGFKMWSPGFDKHSGDLGDSKITSKSLKKAKENTYNGSKIPKKSPAAGNTYSEI